MPAFSTESAFALKVAFGVGIGGVLVFLAAPRLTRSEALAWLDVYLGGLAGALIGGRLGFVLEHLPLYSENISYIPRLSYAELSWQGAVLGGLTASYAAARWRKVAWASYSDSLALALPSIFMAVCWACRSAGLLLGHSTSLEGLPVWAAGYLPDLSRHVQARYELQALGIALGLALLWWVALPHFAGLWRGQGLAWCGLGLGLCVLTLDHFSANPRLTIYTWRVDQASAFLLIAASLFFWGRGLSAKRRENAPLPAPQSRL
jgi:prolipoprotein diacylglyceryltransferase